MIGSTMFGMPGSSEWNAALSAIVRLLICSVVISLFVFRARAGAPKAAFRLGFAPIFAAIALAFCVYMLVTRPFGQAWIVLAAVAVGHGLWLATRSRTPATGMGG